MADANPTTTAGLFHVVFLERTTAEFDESPQGRLGQAAFLVLRLIDLLTASRPGRSQDELFRYQAAATARHCREEVEPGTETDHLLALVRSATEAQRRRQPGWVAPSLLAYASMLDDAARYEEALDVLQTLERVAGSRLEAPHAIAAALRAGRVNRETARFDDADAAYERAATLAATAGDRRSALLSRLGRANVLIGRGNLAEAERRYREIVQDAKAAGERDAEARAEHGLGVVLGSRGQVPDAIPHLWQAFELYADRGPSLWALHDLGFALARLGAMQEAERALLHVFERADSQELAQNAAIELMHCASFRRDRVGFTRWRAECLKRCSRMAPHALADYHLKAGVGLARFAKLADAETELTHAMAVARTHRLHEFEFRIERIRGGLRDCRELEPAEHSASPQPHSEGEGILQVSRSLARL